MCHRQFFKIYSQNLDYVKTHCTDINNTFLFASRKWISAKVHNLTI